MDFCDCHDKWTKKITYFFLFSYFSAQRPFQNNSEMKQNETKQLKPNKLNLFCVSFSSSFFPLKLTLDSLKLNH